MTEEKKTDVPAQAAGTEKAPGTFRALLGEKLRMTQLFTKEGDLKAVTVVKAGPCPVVRVKDREAKDGYAAVLLGYGPAKEKSVNKPWAGQFKAAGISPTRHLKEFRVPSVQGLKPGQTVDVEGRFSPGDFVDVQGTSKGRGFAGVMKRHGFSGLPASHGASDKERSPGSLTSRRSLGKVLSGQRMAGHMGAVTTTVQKIEVISVDAENNLLYLNGPVPGANGSLVSIRETVKALKRRRVVEKKAQVKRDKMGNIIVEKSPKKKAK